MGRLAKVYIRERGAEPTDMDEAALEAALAAAVETGQRAWPGLDLKADLFVRHLAQRQVSLGGAELRAGDLYLACACAQGLAPAIETLDSTYLARIPAFVTRTINVGEIADELRQQLRQRLLIGDAERPARIGDYRGLGSLESWLRAAAARLALNLLRADQRQQRARARAAAEAKLALADPETEYLKEMHRPDLEKAVRAAFAAITPRERTLLRLRYVDGVGVGRIATSYGVHRATVTTWLGDAQRRLFRSVREALRLNLELTTTECDSMIRLLNSRLELAISGVFTRPRQPKS
jgi:RNA polymerase sigma-70 factor (ECF subfamily)